MSDAKAQPTSLEALRTDAAVAFEAAPEPAFKYGLNVFFAPKEVTLGFGDVSVTHPSEVRVPPGVQVMSFADALQQPALAARVLERLAAQDERVEKIGAWHRSQTGLGTLVIVPPDLSSDEPIRVDLTFHDERRVENLIIEVGEGSRVTIVEHLRSEAANAAVSTSPSLRSSITDIVAGPSSKVTHISLQDYSEHVTDFSLKRAQVKRDASITWIECLFGGAFSQSLVTTVLQEEGASVGSKTMFFGRHKQKFDLAQRVQHLASNTHSELGTRGALADTAKTIYRGLVRIEKGTRQCTGHQKEDTLLLGEKAEIDAVPNLEIESDDVRCGHGATVGRVNKDSLFYLMSRGLDEATARTFLVNGFFAPIVAEMRAAGLEDRVQCIIDERVAPAAS